MLIKVDEPRHSKISVSGFLCHSRLVNSFAKNGTVITIPETNISEEIEEEVSELRANATPAGLNMTNQTSEAAGTFAEEAVDVMSNITQSVRDLFR